MKKTDSEIIIFSKCHSNADIKRRNSQHQNTRPSVNLDFGSWNQVSIVSSLSSSLFSGSSFPIYACALFTCYLPSECVSPQSVAATSATCCTTISPHSSYLLCFHFFHTHRLCHCLHTRRSFDYQAVPKPGTQGPPLFHPQLINRTRDGVFQLLTVWTHLVLLISCGWNGVVGKQQGTGAVRNKFVNHWPKRNLVSPVIVHSPADISSCDWLPALSYSCKTQDVLSCCAF